jgi:hypothetical protein
VSNSAATRFCTDLTEPDLTEPDLTKLDRIEPDRRETWFIRHLNPVTALPLSLVGELSSACVTALTA